MRATMHTLRTSTLGVLALLLLVTACRKEPLYELNTVGLLPSSANKDREKTNEQYVAILHANLFQSALSANQLFRLAQCIESIGDKELAREVIISNFMNKPGVLIPSDAEMHADLDAFIINTYERFLVRRPTEAELTWFRNYISTDPNVSAELVWFSFAMSNEYLFY